jgi:hypothetical protein
MFSALSAQDIVFGVLVLGFVVAIAIPNFTQRGAGSAPTEADQTGDEP